MTSDVIAMDRRFSGVERLFGVDGARRITEAHVVVIGIGGVGSWAAESLARSGVGRLTLIDLDHVAESNINRQVHAAASTIGQAKVLAMQDRIHAFYPECQVYCVDEFVNATACDAYIPPNVHAVIDACDQVAVKSSLAAWAMQSKTTFVTSGAAGGKRQAQLVCVDDLSKATHDPLLSKVRYQLRKNFGAPREGKKMGVVSVFSAETVVPPNISCGVVGDGSLNCSGFGSLVTVTGTFGLCAAGFVLNQLAGATAETG